MDEYSIYEGAWSGAQIDSAIGKVVNADSTPTANSTNMVTSGGVKSALDGSSIDASTLTINPDVADNVQGRVIKIGGVVSINIILAVKANATIGPYTDIVQLPSGYRPSSTVFCGMITSDSSNHVMYAAIRDNGTICQNHVTSWSPTARTYVNISATYLVSN